MYIYNVYNVCGSIVNQLLNFGEQKKINIFIYFQAKLKLWEPYMNINVIFFLR